MENQKSMSLSDAGAILLGAVILGFIGFYYGGYMEKNSYNPRKAVINNNRDTFYFQDTAYIVKISIDSIYEIDEDNEPVKPIQ